MQLKYVFRFALPKIHSNENAGLPLTDSLFVDVGSRLGAVLYGVSVIY